MTDPNTIEARLAALEAAVAAIQKQLGPPPHRTAADLLDSLPKFLDDEAFREFQRIIEENRKADRAAVEAEFREVDGQTGAPAGYPNTSATATDPTVTPSRTTGTDAPGA